MRLAVYSVEPRAQAALAWLVPALAPIGGPGWKSFHPHRQPKCHSAAIQLPFRTLPTPVELAPGISADPEYVASYETAKA